MKKIDRTRFNPDSLHPDCPDLKRLAPTTGEAILRAEAAGVDAENATVADRWARAEREEEAQLNRRAVTRRTVLTGAAVGAGAMVTSQLVSMRASFGATTDGTLVVLFLEGGADGLSLLFPANDPNLVKERPGLSMGEADSIGLGDGWALTKAFEPLYKYWRSGELAFVPATSAPEIGRSHFESQEICNLGGLPSARSNNGWLDSVIAQLGPGTAFRAVSKDDTLARSLVGTQGAIALRSLEDFGLNGSDKFKDATQAALAKLFTGVEHPVADQAALALKTLSTASAIAKQDYKPADGVTYEGGLGNQLKELAQLIKSKAGLRVATVNMGGWDTHENQGSRQGGYLYNKFGEVAKGLGAFMDDLGDLRSTVTVLVVSEFGRRIAQNGSGLDHGHGSVCVLLGGKVAGGKVHGKWAGLDSDVRDNGDVPGLNVLWDVYGSVAAGRFDLTTAQVAKITPNDHSFTRIPFMK